MDIQKYIQSLSQCLDLCREWTEAELRLRNGFCTMCCFTDYQKEIEILLGRIREVDMEKVLLELAKHSKARIRSLAVPLSRVKIHLSVNPYGDEFLDEVPLEYMHEMFAKLYTEVERINKDMAIGIIQECGFDGWDDLFPLPDENKHHEREIPLELNNDDFMGILERAINAGYIKKEPEGYAWKSTKVLCAYFSQEVSSHFELSNKRVGDEGKIATSWKPFEQLFNIKKISGEKYGWLKENGTDYFYPNGADKIDDILNP